MGHGLMAESQTLGAKQKIPVGNTARTHAVHGHHHHCTLFKGAGEK